MPLAQVRTLLYKEYQATWPKEDSCYRQGSISVGPVAESATVKEVSDVAGAELMLEAPYYVKLMCGPSVLLPAQPVAELESRDLFGVMSQENDVKLLKQAVRHSWCWLQRYGSCSL